MWMMNFFACWQFREDSWVDRQWSPLLCFQLDLHPVFVTACLWAFLLEGPYRERQVQVWWPVAGSIQSITPRHSSRSQTSLLYWHVHLCVCWHSQRLQTTNQLQRYKPTGDTSKHPVSCSQAHHLWVNLYGRKHDQSPVSHLQKSLLWAWPQPNDVT